MKMLLYILILSALLFSCTGCAMTFKAEKLEFSGSKQGREVITVVGINPVPSLGYCK